MTTIFAPHLPDAQKLAAVTAEMERLGAPTIRAVWCGDHYKAIEGSHRLAAAHDLGITPEIDALDESAVVEHDMEELPTPCAALDIIVYLYDRPEAVYDFEDMA